MQGGHFAQPGSFQRWVEEEPAQLSARQQQPSLLHARRQALGQRMQQWVLMVMRDGMSRRKPAEHTAMDVLHVCMSHVDELTSVTSRLRTACRKHAPHLHSSALGCGHAVAGHQQWLSRVNVQRIFQQPDDEG